MNYFLINLKSNRGLSNFKTNKYINKMKKKEECCSIDIMELSTKETNFIESLNDTDKVYICGGDGTVSIFLNAVKDAKIKCRIFVFKNGSGNDLAKEFKGNAFEITDVVKTMPKISTDNEEFVCINGCGMGVDALVCHEKNRYDATKIKKSYTKICLEVFKKYKPYSLDVIVDGEKKHYDNVWFFVANHGKYFGGGKKVTPYASRHDDKIDVCIAYGFKYPKVLLAFPLMVFGLHLKIKKNIAYFQCEKFEAFISENEYLQIDGEVKEGVNHLVVESKRS